MGCRSTKSKYDR